MEEEGEGRGWGESRGARGHMSGGGAASTPRRSPARPRRRAWLRSNTPRHRPGDVHPPSSRPPRGPTWPRARLWSRRVMAVMFSAGMEGAFSFRIRALVLAGLATTRICVGAGCVDGDEGRGSTAPTHSCPCRPWRRVLWRGWKRGRSRGSRRWRGAGHDHPGPTSDSPRPHLGILVPMLLQRGSLGLVDGHILGHDVLALHAGLAGVGGAEVRRGAGEPKGYGDAGRQGGVSAWRLSCWAVAKHMLLCFQNPRATTHPDRGGQHTLTPTLRGNPPTRMATSMPLKASFTSVVATTPGYGGRMMGCRGSAQPGWCRPRARRPAPYLPAGGMRSPPAPYARPPEPASRARCPAGAGSRADRGRVRPRAPPVGPRHSRFGLGGRGGRVA